MEFISKDRRLIETLKSGLLLLSAQIDNIKIYQEKSQLIIDVYLELVHAKRSNKIILRFNNVRQYSFYYHETTIFYFIEIIKFFETAGNFYISFDPVNEKEEISDEDQDFILAESVEGYIIN